MERTVDVRSPAAFQRVIISGGGGALHTSESKEACALLALGLKLRATHCYKKPDYYWGPTKPEDYRSSPRPLHYPGVTSDASTQFASVGAAESPSSYPPGHPLLFREETVAQFATPGLGSHTRRRPELHWSPFQETAKETPGPLQNLFCAMHGGVMHVFDGEGLSLAESPIVTTDASLTSSDAMFSCKTWEEFSRDYLELTRIIHLAFVNTFAHRRLELLEARFQLHAKINVDHEIHESKVSHER